MSIKIQPTPLIFALTFAFGAAAYLERQDVPTWMKLVCGLYQAGLVATGLLKAKTGASPE